jgi:CHAT domain-containing protein
LITTNDLLTFRLQAELVVLSACNTGGGNLSGDGVTGLSRAFIAAGVPSLIVSLWSVPDAPTGELMTVFYEEWLRHGDKAQALRQAMLATRDRYPNPINWAAFTLIGESE